MKYDNIVHSNPINHVFQEQLNETRRKVLIAVPFISTYAVSILQGKDLKKIPDKRLITKFDPSYIHSFHLPTLQKLLSLGFKIRFDNSLHMKLYVLDDTAIISSSNFTQSGFEHNIELSVKISGSEVDKCTVEFEKIWAYCEGREIDELLINENWSKFNVLKRQNLWSERIYPVIDEKPDINVVNPEVIIDLILKSNHDFNRILGLEYEANKSRINYKQQLISKGFNRDIFYPQDYEGDSNSIRYYLLYGLEETLASTGLREDQIRKVFLHQDFQSVVEFILPEMVGLKPWNFQNTDEVYHFCEGLFSFNIPYFAEALPLRLASYFHPETFLPIFKINHLEDIANIFGHIPIENDRAMRYYYSHSYVLRNLEEVPYKLVIKAHIGYLLRTMHLYKLGLAEGDTPETVLKSFKRKWERDLIVEGLELLNRRAH